ncbi:MAG: sigma-70 family RNA polymerase sigma factor [Planctomycetia bacterium]|nr:sigma-70 family RNA polymerase sigma factor [Planctomycetia bacterium]
MSAQSLDEALATRAQSGDITAFECIARNYQAILLRFVRCNFSNIPDPEDVVQESLLKAFENIDKYRPTWPLKNWLLTLTYRMAISRIRHHHVQVRLLESLRSRVIAEVPNPADAVADHEESRNLWKTAAKILTPTQFQAVWLLYAEDMNRGEIAKILGKTRPTTKLILYRATKKLQLHFGAMAGRFTEHVGSGGQMIQGVLL